MGTCECKDPQWKILYCCMQRWCYLYGKALLPGQKKARYLATTKRTVTSYAHFDCGGEVLSQKFIQHLKSKGTQHGLTIHNSLPQNRVSERGMCTCGEVACTLLITSGLLHYLWAEAMAHGWIVGSKINCLCGHWTENPIQNENQAETQPDWYPTFWCHWWACSFDTAVYPSIFAVLSFSLHCWSTTMHHIDVTSHMTCVSLCNCSPLPSLYPIWLALLDQLHVLEWTDDL